jgi:hypothetical protein
VIEVESRVSDRLNKHPSSELHLPAHRTLSKQSMVPDTTENKTSKMDSLKIEICFRAKMALREMKIK